LADLTRRYIVLAHALMVYLIQISHQLGMLLDKEHSMRTIGRED